MASRGFSRAPFGWPDELVRLLLAACFPCGGRLPRATERRRTDALYDYKGADELFSKITSFKEGHVPHRRDEACRSTRSKASKALIAMGVSGTPSPATPSPLRCGALGLTLKSRIDDARIRAQQGSRPRRHPQRRARCPSPRRPGPDGGGDRLPAKEDVWKHSTSPSRRSALPRR